MTKSACSTTARSARSIAPTAARSPRAAQQHHAAAGPEPAQQPVRDRAGRALCRAPGSDAGQASSRPQIRRAFQLAFQRDPDRGRASRQLAGRARCTAWPRSAGRCSTATSSCSSSKSRHDRATPHFCRPPTARSPQLFWTLAGTGLGGIALAALLGAGQQPASRRTDSPGLVARKAVYAPPAALRAAGQAGAGDLLLGRAQPSRHLGLQARADQAARPAAARRARNSSPSRARTAT